MYQVTFTFVLSSASKSAIVGQLPSPVSSAAHQRARDWFRVHIW